MNRKQLREEVAFLLNFREGEADQDFAKTRLNKLIDRAYNLEVERAKTAGIKAYFQAATPDFTWTAGSQTLEFPQSTISAILASTTIIEVFDITSGEPGVPLVFADQPNQGGDIFWKDKDTWQWTGNGGPGTTLTLRAFYEMRAEELEDDDAEPALIPAQFHWLIVWTAAVLGRSTADDRAPDDWRHEQHEMRLDFYKHVSKGRPLSRYPSIQRPNDETSGILF
jgi:hypothetical protein